MPCESRYTATIALSDPCVRPCNYRRNVSEGTYQCTVARATLATCSCKAAKGTVHHYSTTITVYCPAPLLSTTTTVVWAGPREGGGRRRARQRRRGGRRARITLTREMLRSLPARTRPQPPRRSTLSARWTCATSGPNVVTCGIRRGSAVRAGRAALAGGRDAHRRRAACSLRY